MQCACSPLCYIGMPRSHSIETVPLLESPQTTESKEQQSSQQEGGGRWARRCLPPSFPPSSNYLTALQMAHVKADLGGHLQESTEAGCKFNIMQPGSSVATALSEGESKKKHIVLLEVNGEQFRTINYPLETVRPFVHDNVCPCIMHNVYIIYYTVCIFTDVTRLQGTQTNRTDSRGASQ